MAAMAPSLGKRKRITREELEKASEDVSSPSNSNSEGSDSEEDIQDIFRRAFEAKFKPLESESIKKCKKNT